MILTIILFVLAFVCEIIFFVLTGFYVYIWPVFVGVLLYYPVFLLLFAVLIIYLFITSLFMSTKAEIKKPNPYAHFMTIQVDSLLCFIAGARIKTTGLEKMPKEHCLIVLNHVSNFDVMCVMKVLQKRNLYAVTKPENKKIPICGPYIHHAGFLSINRDDPRKGVLAIKESARYIQEYGDVMICPEGTRSKDYKLHDFHPGSFKAAYWAKCPIVVISVNNTEKIKTNFPFKTTKVNFDILKVYNYEEYQEMTTNEIALLAHDMIGEKLKEYEK